MSYVWLGAIAVHRFGDYKNAFRFGQLGYELLEKRGLKRFEAATATVFATGTMPWMKHLVACSGVMRQAFDVANRNGDLTWAVYSRLALNTLLIPAGYPLVEVQGEAEYGLSFAQKAKFGPVVDMITVQLGHIRTLRGLTREFGSLDNADFDEVRFERNVDSYPAATQLYYWVRKLQGRFFAGDFASAIEASLKARSRLSTTPTFEVAEYEFYSALARAALLESAAPDPRREHFEALADHYKLLKVWAEHCPENFEDRAALIGAEIARLEGRELDAERLYDQAIRSARANGYIHNEALTYEVAARFYAARGLENFAETFLVRARDGYMRWGAYGKVRQLETRHPWLAALEPRGRAKATATPDQRLDVAAVVKASQALSSEMLLPPLIERLMAIALQNGGADRGVLIRPDSKGYRIEAEARIDGDGIVLDVSGSDGPSVPETLVRYVMRTQESVILDDAAQQNLFTEDPYLLLRRPRSILCIPLVRQAALSGLLYLENTLAPGVFTAERARLLELLASQAAISLENAALYTDLQLQVGLLQLLPVSTWTLKPDGTPEFVNQVWLEFAGQDLEFVRSHPEAWTAAIHPEDREITAQIFREGVRLGRSFAMEYRSLRARDGVYRAVLSQAVVLRDSEGKVLKFAGTTTDIDDQKRAEEALRQAHADLARVNRVTTMGELAASLVHEVSQPVSGALTNTAVCLRKLEREKPDIDEVRGVVTRIARDAQRAAEIIDRIRSQFRKSFPKQETLDVSTTILEVVALLRSEAVRCNVSVRTDLSPDLPAVVGDRVQLQQVVMNLFVNSIEAMKEVEGTRVIVVQSRQADEHVLVSVSDSGIGLPPQVANQIFDPFFTTKPDGTGMGLRISRSIVESHGGRLWAAANEGPGATLTFSLPCKAPT